MAIKSNSGHLNAFTPSHQYIKLLMNHIVIIPAAGIGSRFGATLPKQYAPIAGQAMLQHTINRFAQHPIFIHIAIIIAPDDAHFAQHIHLPNHAAAYPIGGDTRAKTVKNGVDHLLNKHIAQAEDLLFVHDAARCCLPNSALNRLIHAANYPNGALLALPVADTLKQQNNTQCSLKTIDRQGLWQAQTPQVFQAALLQNALAKADLNMITDEASAIENLGLFPLLVEGDRRNFKLTRPDDAPWAEYLLNIS